MDYSYWKSIKKSIKVAVLGLFGLLIAGLQVQYPELASLTILAVLQFLYDWLKKRWGVRLP